jgi:hypothetical protein
MFSNIQRGTLVPGNKAFPVLVMVSARMEAAFIKEEGISQMVSTDRSKNTNYIGSTFLVGWCEQFVEMKIGR